MVDAARDPMATLETAAAQLWGPARLPAVRPLLRRTAEALVTVQAVPLPPEVEPFPPGPSTRGKA